MEENERRSEVRMRRTALRGALSCVSVLVGVCVAVAVSKSQLESGMMAGLNASLRTMAIPGILGSIVDGLLRGGLLVAFPGVSGLLAGVLCWRLLTRHVLKTAAEN